MFKRSWRTAARRPFDIHSVTVVSTNINSWAGFLPGVGRKDVKREPVAALAKKVVDKDSDNVAESDLKEFWRKAWKEHPGLNFGPDRRPIYTADPDVRVGPRSANSEGRAVRARCRCGQLPSVM